jgi:hypothetical protein
MVKGQLQPPLAGFDRPHHDASGELLAYRTRLKNRLRSDRHLQLDVRQTIAFGPNRLSVTGHQQGQTRNMLFLHLGAHESSHFIRRLIRRGELRRKHCAKAGNHEFEVFQRKAPVAF